ncbi:hypothetical protein NDU88_007358, partial [Pleurodeles waltl]
PVPMLRRPSDPPAPHLCVADSLGRYGELCRPFAQYVHDSDVIPARSALSIFFSGFQHFHLSLQRCH